MYMLKKYLIFSFILTLIDSIYLYLVGSHFNKVISSVQKSPLKLKPIPTAICYLVITLGVFYFAVLKNFSIQDCFLLGLFVYAVYELTNMAILKNWDWFTVVIDSLWGGILFSLSVFIFRLF